ncbi:EthD family reductase [Rhodococcus sovatensis]|uniref:EthD family reductase n=1 Tax=Rhodococcus sovatensis TaxID=1805840 RepID=A0ABZ2PIH0_9NOCA
MFSVSICYHEPADAAAFDQYYATVHAPIVRTVPGLASFTASRCRALGPGSSTPFYMVAQLSFGTADDLAAALRSSEMTSAGQDLKNFASEVTMYTAEDLICG